jgi:hypothetical protein
LRRNVLERHVVDARRRPVVAGRFLLEPSPEAALELQVLLRSVSGDALCRAQEVAKNEEGVGARSMGYLLRLARDA